MINPINNSSFDPMLKSGLNLRFYKEYNVQGVGSRLDDRVIHLRRPLGS